MPNFSVRFRLTSFVRRPSRVSSAAAALLLALATISRLTGAEEPSSAAAPPATASTSGGALPGEISVSISRPGIQKIAIALPSLAAPAGAAEPVATINETLVADVETSGVFARVEPSLYPESPGDTLPVELAAKWRNSGAEVLVGGRIELVSGTLVLDARVWDLKSAKMIMGRRYKGAPTWARRIAHTLANDLLYYFTGRNGTFLTRIAFVSDRSGSKEIWVMDNDGEAQTRLTGHGTLALHPDWSPDASSIVYQQYAASGPQLARIPSGGGALVPIRTGLDLNASPSFSPDGQKIAFIGARRGSSAVFVVNSDGTGIRQLTQFRGVEAAPCWSPTGREIAFVSNRSGSPQIYVMDAEGANVRRLTFEGSFNDTPSWSPDGGRIAFSMRTGGDFNISVIDLATGLQSVLTDRGRNENPTWSPDGLRIAFSSTRRGSEQVFVMEADGANPRALTSQGNNFSPSWSKIGL